MHHAKKLMWSHYIFSIFGRYVDDEDVEWIYDCIFLLIFDGGIGQKHVNLVSMMDLPLEEILSLTTPFFWQWIPHNMKQIGNHFIFMEMIMGKDQPPYLQISEFDIVVGKLVDFYYVCWS